METTLAHGLIGPLRGPESPREASSGFCRQPLDQRTDTSRGLSWVPAAAPLTPMKKTILSLAVLLTATLASQNKPAPSKPEVGKLAPIIRLNDHDGKAVQIKANDEERWTVLAFFPKAATPG